MPLPYSKKVLQHFNKPHNYGKMKNPDGVGEVGNIVCGDIMKLYIKVGKNKQGKEIIKDIKFETFGCVAAVAVSSMVTVLAKGKTLEDALKIRKDDILGTIGQLPETKIHCSVLADDALHEAIYDYYSKNKRAIPEDLLERHKVLQKQLKIVEERHKDYTEMERKFLSGEINKC